MRRVGVFFLPGEAYVLISYVRFCEGKRGRAAEGCGCSTCVLASSGPNDFPDFKAAASGRTPEGGNRKHRGQNLFARRREEPGSAVRFSQNIQKYILERPAPWELDQYGLMEGGEMIQITDRLHVHSTGNNYRSLQCCGDSLVLGCRALIALWVWGDMVIFGFEVDKELLG